MATMAHVGSRTYRRLLDMETPWKLERWNMTIWESIVSLDKLLNKALGGEPDETISSRLGRESLEGSKLAKAVCKILHVFDSGHCGKSVTRQRKDASRQVGKAKEHP